MTLLLAHFVLLAWMSYAIARHLVANSLDRVIVTAMAFWGHVVLLSLLLSQIHKLGETAWFFRSSLVLGALSVLAVRRFVAAAPLPESRPPEERSAALLVAVIGSLFVIFLVNVRVAAAYAPNNYDSLAYHLPRTMYYMGHNTLAQFESADIRQTYFTFNYNLLQLFCFIYSPPHWVINFLNLISWVITGFGVYRVSRLCGCSINASLIALWFALTATEVLAQATTTTLDLPTVAALLATMVFLLHWRRDALPRQAWLAAGAFGVAFGAKLTVVFFGPAIVFLLAVLLFQHWQRGAAKKYFAGVRAWMLPGVLAGVLALPFIIYNIAATGQWMTHDLDFTLNKPFSFGVFWQSSKAYLFQLFFEPFGRFSFDTQLIGQLNEWFSHTFFKHWNEAYAYSGFYVIPPDLNEDHVWYGFAGPLFLVCALICLWRDRRLRGPIAWLALLGLGWLATYFAMNKWSMYIQRYFLPAIVLMAPCAAAVWDASRSRVKRAVFVLVAATALWFAINYLAENHNRPFSLPGSNFTPPKILPDVPQLLRDRLAPQPRINIMSDAANERIYLLMNLGQNQRFTSSRQVDPAKYNVFSYWGFTRNNIYNNIAYFASYTVVSVPAKPTAGVEFLGTVGDGVNAFDYAGLIPHANETESTKDNRNIAVLVYYARTDPDRFAHGRLRVDGLNPRDHARVEITAELNDGGSQTLLAQTHSGEVDFSLLKPFKRLAIQVVDVTTGKVMGTGDLPHTTKPTASDVETPVSATTLFRTEIITSGSARNLSVNGLADLEGPYAQWDLPFFRWSKQPVVRIEVPANPKLKRLKLTFNVRLQVRDSASLRLTLNGKVIRDFSLSGRNTWLKESVDLEPANGDNVIELKDNPAYEVPDWLGYLELNKDVKEYVISRAQPLEEGAKEHYEQHGRFETRTLPMKPNPSPDLAPPESLYFLYRTLTVEGFSK